MMSTRPETALNNDKDVRRIWETKWGKKIMLVDTFIPNDETRPSVQSSLNDAGHLISVFQTLRRSVKRFLFRYKFLQPCKLRPCLSNRLKNIFSFLQSDNMIQIRQKFAIFVIEIIQEYSCTVHSDKWKLGLSVMVRSCRVQVPSYCVLMMLLRAVQKQVILQGIKRIWRVYWQLVVS